MRKQFGNTYWGAQFLEALTEIDYSNRLPRGKTYARKGAAHDIKMDKNTITAKVDGSAFHPYGVNIEIRKFSKTQIDTIVALVTENPVYLSQLLNRQLPAELNATLEQNGISVFPKSWSDIKGKCSCPDSAVPCKHLAAVLYMVANEVDKNPFLIFELHDFRLLEALEESGFVAQGQQETPALTISSLLATEELQLPVFEWSDAAFQQIDFSKLPDCSAQMMTIYGEEAVFFPEGSFRKIVEAAYKSIANKSTRNTEANTYDIPLNKVAYVPLLLDDEWNFVNLSALDREENILGDFEDMASLVEWLESIPLRDVKRYNAHLSGLLLTYYLAKNLVKNWAFLPQLLKTEQGHFTVRWLPAVLNKAVKTICEAVSQLVPQGSLFFTHEDDFLDIRPEHHFDGLLSVFLNHFVHEYNGLNDRQLLNTSLALFFAGTTERFIDFEDQEYPSAIQIYLNKFFIQEKEYAPVIQVEEEENDQPWTTFLVTASVNDRTQPMQPPIPIADLFKNKKYNHLRLDAIRDLSMLAEHFPKLNDYLSQKGKEPLRYNSQTFAKVLLETLPIIRLFGIEILLPKALRRLVRPSVSLAMQRTNEGGSNASSGLVNLKEMLNFDWTVALGDQFMDKDEFIALAQQFEGIVKLNDQFVFIDEKELKSLIEKMKMRPQMSTNDLLKVALTQEYAGQKIKLEANAQQLIDDLLAVAEIPAPAGLLATLRPYQQRGYEWMYKNAQLGFGSIIADDMGLGKTLQVITLLLKLKEEGAFKKSKALIIVPTTLLTNWGKEIQKFAPKLTAHIYHGANRKLEPLEDANLLITTYGVVRTEQKQLEKIRWLLIAIDEAQAIKNPTASQTKAVKKIKAPIRIAMSGTPVENRLSEYWSIFDYTHQGYLGSLGNFKKTYAKSIEVDRDQGKLDEFKKITAPFILRRLKSDRTIIKDLPDKIETDHFSALTSEQAALYENVVKTTMETIEQSEGIARKGLVLKLITALKQVCNHPYQFLKKGTITPERSGKAVLLLKLLTDILEKDDKVIIFTQYQTMGTYLQQILSDHLALEAEFLHGGVSRKDRDAMVDRFQQNRDARILILSLKAGGTGLNLVAANHVIHYDLWWNPAVEAQATDRAYRIGQNKNVLVHRFISQGTFEEKINELLQSKKELADLTVSTGETWIGDYGDDELRDLVRMDG